MGVSVRTTTSPGDNQPHDITHPARSSDRSPTVDPLSYFSFQLKVYAILPMGRWFFTICPTPYNRKCVECVVE